MIRYQQRPTTLEAAQVLDAATAAELLGGVVANAPADAWAVEVDRDGVLLSWEGAIGDYLVADPWRVVARATFEAAWVPASVVVSARDAQASATTILGLRRGSVDLADATLVGGL